MKLSEIAGKVRELADAAGIEVYLSSSGCFHIRGGNSFDDENNFYCWLTQGPRRPGGRSPVRLPIDGHNLTALDGATGGVCRRRYYCGNDTAWRRASILRRMLVREFNLLKAVIS
jgi:hypothetical protein